MRVVTPEGYFRIVPNGMPVEADFFCTVCGHKWHAVRGNKPGDIEKKKQPRVECPSCEASNDLGDVVSQYD